jgi:hypothetical protein
MTKQGMPGPDAGITHPLGLVGPAFKAESIGCGRKARPFVPFRRGIPQRDPPEGRKVVRLNPQIHFLEESSLFREELDLLFFAGDVVDQEVLA